MTSLQLLSITLYNDDGETRVVDFRPGELNIVTGDSKAGKSTLLTIVDYCLGRKTARVPAGPIETTVAWYATLWQLGTEARVLLARPRFRTGASSNSSAMIEFGGASMEAPPLEQLRTNADADSLRKQLGQRIGLGDVRIDPGDESLRGAYSVGVGSAALFVFQDQEEIASKQLLFHRQSDPRVAQDLRDAFPYFLGATEGDDAERREQLRGARRAVSSLVRQRDAAIAESANLDETLQGLLAEAFGAGMTEVATAPTPEIAMEILHRLRGQLQPLAVGADIEADSARRELNAERAQLGHSMRDLLAQRALLLDQEEGEGGYSEALSQQLGRLSSLELFASETEHDSARCPICGHAIDAPDPTVEQLSERLSQLRSDLAGLQVAEPARQKSLSAIEVEVGRLRSRVLELDSAISTLDALTNVGSGADQREFIRGRIDATLARLNEGEADALLELEHQLEAARSRVAALEETLDDDAAAARLSSRLAAVARDMTELAGKLELEHSEIAVRLDVDHLTVYVDTEDAPFPLSAIGSAANLIGYHLVTHLALHRFFVRRDRPVPRLLMLDQPTQAYFPSEETRTSGQPGDDTDRRAVSAMFQVIQEVVESLAGELQVIVVDHADLQEDWFQERVRHNWRGEKLIPESWIENARTRRSANTTEAE